VTGARRAPIVVIGIGHPARTDDAVGVVAIDQLGRNEACAGVELVTHNGEPAGLLDAWRDRRLAIVLDAVVRGARPGTIHRLDGVADSASRSTTSSHGAGLADAVRLAEQLDRRPDVLIVYGIEPADVGYGVDLTPAVAAAVPLLLQHVLAELPRPASTP
jgi:hydrogenase maturation protease